MPLFLFNQFGDLKRSSLRPGNVHSADDWEGVLKPVVVRYKSRKIRLYFRGNAAFASPEMYKYLEAEGFLYAIRLPKNRLLQESIGHLLTRPVGRPPNHVLRFYASFSYQAGSWDRYAWSFIPVDGHAFRDRGIGPCVEPREPAKRSRTTLEPVRTPGNASSAAAFTSWESA